MSNSGALGLASGVGGSIGKEQVLLAVTKYEKYHARHGGDDEERKANYTDMVNKYYDLTASFCEYGWGESFHFAPRWKGESFRENMKKHEHFLALQLGVGCGVWNWRTNERDIKIQELNHIAGVDKTCNYVKADFMKMPFPNNSFDAVFAMEALCHAPDVLGCYKEIYRVLKPGQCFAACDWCITDSFNPTSIEHKRIKGEIELGNGLPDIRLTVQCLRALKEAGFEIIYEKDLALESPLPWYSPLDKNVFSLATFRTTAFGRFITRNMLKTLEFLGVAPKGSHRVQCFLEEGADALVEGGRLVFHVDMPLPYEAQYNTDMKISILSGFM
ncbi:Cycloartenol-C-24-methyltransferase [Ancistrocladus abbreviatus]